jgi:hypothetical protein
MREYDVLFWLVSIFSVYVLALALRFIHTVPIGPWRFHLLLVVTLVSSNAAFMALMVVGYMEQTASWSSMNALKCLPLIAACQAICFRKFWPLTYTNLPGARTIIWRYFVILFTSGLIGGYGLAAFKIVRHSIKSNDWSFVLLNRIMEVEISSMYTLLLSIIVAVGPITSREQ